MSLLELKGVTRKFNSASVAVSNVDLKVEQGELLALTGESGCGKTTLLRLIAGLEQPDSGSILIDDQSVATPGGFTPPQRRSVGLVFQDYALFPHMTVEQNVEFGLRSMSAGQRQQRSQEMLKLVNLTTLESRFPHQLSGGQQQRVAIARALAPQPKLLLLDEPFSNLDTQLKDQVRQEISLILKNAGTTTILVTHDVQDALSMADSITVLRKGKVLQTGRPPQLYQHPVDSYVASFFGRVNLIPVEVKKGSMVSELGSFPMAVENGRSGLLCLRPQHIRIESAEEQGTTAQILSVHYLGNCQQLELKSGACKLWCHQPLGLKYETGMSVKVSFNVDAAHIIWNKA